MSLLDILICPVCLIIGYLLMELIKRVIKIEERDYRFKHRYGKEVYR